MQENKLYYILTSSVKRVKGYNDQIEVWYSNGFTKLKRTYTLGDYIETIINIEE